MKKVTNEITTENKARKKQLRRAVGSMAFIALLLLTQVLTIRSNFTWKSTLFIASSTLALALYIYGLVDVTKYGIKGALKFKIVNSWVLIAYLIDLLIIDTIFK